MKRSLSVALLLALAMLVVATPAFAQDGAANKYSFGSWALLAAGLAIGVAAAGCGLGQGRAVASACEGTARNPGAGGRIFILAIMGLAFIESLVIYALVVSFSVMGQVKDLADAVLKQ